MLIAGDALAKTLAKYQKITFWNKKNGFVCFFFANYWRCFYSNLVQKSYHGDTSKAKKEVLLFSRKMRIQHKEEVGLGAHKTSKSIS